MGNTIEIIQGSTPTLELSLPTSIDLSATNIYFSIEQFDKKVVAKDNTDQNQTDITFQGSTVSVYLSQIETLHLAEGSAKVQINLVSGGGRTRIPTYESQITILHNQDNRVLT